MAKSGQQPSKADEGGQRPATEKKPSKPTEDSGSASGTGTPRSKPMPPSSGQSGAKKG